MLSSFVWPAWKTAKKKHIKIFKNNEKEVHRISCKWLLHSLSSSLFSQRLYSHLFITKPVSLLNLKKLITFLFSNGPFSIIVVFINTPLLDLSSPPLFHLSFSFLFSLSSMDLVVYTEATTQIQHVNRKSSDELLRKFADPDEVDEPTTKSTKRRRKVVTTTTRENGADVESNVTTAGLVERKRLLLAPAVSKRRSMFLRQIASGKTHLKNKSLVRTIGKVHSNLYTNITYLLSSFLQKLLNVFFLCSFCNSDMA